MLLGSSSDAVTYLIIIHLWCIINKTKLLEQLETLISLIVSHGSDINNRSSSLDNFWGSYGR